MLHCTLLIAFQRHVLLHTTVRFPSNANSGCTVFEERTWSRTHSLDSIELLFCFPPVLFFLHASNDYFFLQTTWAEIFTLILSVDFPLFFICSANPRAYYTARTVEAQRKLLLSEENLNAFPLLALLLVWFNSKAQSSVRWEVLSLFCLFAPFEFIKTHQM